MRVVHTIANTPGYAPSMYDIHSAVTNFYLKYKVRPLAVRMTFNDLQSFMTTMPQQVIPLEAGKVYDNYIQTVFGPIKLIVLDESDILVTTQHQPYNPSLPNSSQMLTTVIVVDNDEVDQAFEKHVLNG